MITSELSPAIQRAQDLIRIPSISDTTDQNVAQNHIARDIQAHGIRAEIDGVGNVSALTRGKNPRRRLLFLCHPDVVRANKKSEKWEGHDPFDGIIENEILWGRGAVDMKGPMASALETMYKIKEKYGEEPPISVQFMSNVNEETSGNGARNAGYYLDKEMADVDELYVVVTEATGLTTIMYGHKGQIPFTARAEGTALHASKVNEADPHAPFVAARFTVDIEDLNNRWKQIIDPEFGSPSVTVTQPRGDGGSSNTISGFVEQDVDARTIPGFEQTAHTELHEIAKKFEPKGVTFNYPEEFPPARSDPNSKVARSAEVAIPGLSKEIFPATSDMGQLLSEMGPNNQYKTEFIIWGPGDFKLAHQDGERISISEIDKAVNAYLKLYEELAK